MPHIYVSISPLLTVTCVSVTLRRIGSRSTIAGTTTNAGIETIVIWLALIATFADNILMTLALAYIGIALQGTELITVAALAVL